MHFKRRKCIFGLFTLTRRAPSLSNGLHPRHLYIFLILILMHTHSDACSSQLLVLRTTIYSFIVLYSTNCMYIASRTLVLVLVQQLLASTSYNQYLVLLCTQYVYIYVHTIYCILCTIIVAKAVCNNDRMTARTCCCIHDIISHINRQIERAQQASLHYQLLGYI